MGGTSLSDCIPCSVGKYSVSGSKLCSSCELGKYTSSSGSYECTKCETGKFTDTNGTISCKPCIDNSEENVESTKCLCNPGTYFDDEKNALNAHLMQNVIEIVE